MTDLISKRPFWNIIQPEIVYFGKKWEGKDQIEKERNETTVLTMYYNRLRHHTQYDLEIAFNRYRDENKTFPKINQIKALLPRASDTYEAPNHKSSPMPDSVKRKVNEWSASPEMKLQMVAMVKVRWPDSSLDLLNKRFGVTV